MFSFLRNIIHRYLQSIYASLRFYSPKFLDLFLTYLFSVVHYEFSFCRPEVRSFDLIFPFTKKGGGTGIFSGQVFNVTFQFTEFYRFLCSFVTYSRS